MRIRISLIVFALLAAPAIHAQFPTDGRLENNSYVNSYFKIIYSWPKFLRPFDISSLRLPPKSAYNDEFLLFSASQGNEPYGIVMLAQKLNVPTAHTHGFSDEPEFINWVIRGFLPEQHVTGQT